MKQITDRCKDCKECIPCKELINKGADITGWKIFHICRVLADGDDGFAMVVNPKNDLCEMFTPRGEKK